MGCRVAFRGTSRPVGHLRIRDTGFTGGGLVVLMVIAAFRLYRIAICIRLHRSRGSVTAGNRLILYQEAVCIGLVFYILAIRIGFHLKLPADLLAVFVVLVYRLIAFLVFRLFRRLRGSCRGFLRLHHTVAGSYITDKLAFLIDTGVGRNLCADLLDGLRWRVAFIAKQKLVQLNDVALQRCRNNHGTLLAHVRVTAGLRESGSLAQMELVDVLCIAYQIIDPDTGRHLREHGSDQRI